MADRDAVCAIEFRGDVFRFSDVGQVRRSEYRLRQDNIHEEQLIMSGRFLGVLPARRTFEFLESDNDRPISGGIDRSIYDANVINRILDRPAIIRVKTRQIGSARPRYLLLEYNYRDDLFPKDAKK